MKILHRNVVSSCEYFVDGELALICYKGTIDKSFIYDCILAKTENEMIRSSRFVLLDLREAEFNLSRHGIIQIADLIREKIGLRTSLALIVDKPRETAIAYLLRQSLSLNDVRVFASPRSAFSTFEPRTTKDLYASVIYSMMCN